MSVNLAVVRGICSSPAEVRELPSGSTLVLLQVTTRHGEEAAISVPVVAWDPPGSVSEFDVGDEVVAVGLVRRRFFRDRRGHRLTRRDRSRGRGARRDRRRVQAAAAARERGARGGAGVTTRHLAPFAGASADNARAGAFDAPRAQGA